MRRAWVEIDLGALLRNGATLAAHAGVPLLPMVKADAYGLGAVRVALTLERLDPWGFGVATVAEGEELRHAGINRPIVIFSPLLVEDADAAVRSNLTPSFGNAAAVQRWRETRRPWHLAIDTGMNRAGIQWNEIDLIVDVARTFPPEGAFTHFHSAERNDESRRVQEERFAQAVARLPIRPPMLHAENSPAVEHRGRSSHNVVRPGIFLYGVSSGNAPQIIPAPVVALRARVVELRTTISGDTVSYGGTYRADGPRRIATLSVGYADGYRRAFGNCAPVLLHGQRVQVAGMVTMDMTMIDVTDVPCEIGDVATLIGRDGEASIDITDLAAAAELSPYEVLTGLGGRLPRRYVGRAE